MDAPNKTPFAVERVMWPKAGHPAEERSAAYGQRLNITVVFTSVKSTIPALRQAGMLARNLGAQITLLVLQLVPYPRSLDSSPVEAEWNRNRLEEMAAQCTAPTTVRVYLCRNRLETLTSVLRSGSIVVIGRRSNFWPTSEVLLADKLRRRGYEVILTGAE